MKLLSKLTGLLYPIVLLPMSGKMLIGLPSAVVLLFGYAQNHAWNAVIGISIMLGICVYAAVALALISLTRVHSVFDRYAMMLLPADACASVTYNPQEHDQANVV